MSMQAALLNLAQDAITLCDALREALDRSTRPQNTMFCTFSGVRHYLRRATTWSRQSNSVEGSIMRFVRVALAGSFAALLFAEPASAQFGLRGGVNLSKFVGSDAAESETTKGLNLGLTVPLFKIGPISLVPELYYAQKGGKQFNPLAPGEGFEFDLAYVEVPLLAKLTIPLNQSRTLSAYIAGGPAFAWEVDCSFSSTSAGTTTEVEDCEETFGSFDTAMKKADRGIVANAGINFSLFGMAGLNLDARM